MTRRKSLKGNRQAQRNYMAKELQKKQYQGRAVPAKNKYNKKEERRHEKLFTNPSSQFFLNGEWGPSD